jgi:hypothetical protein
MNFSINDLTIADRIHLIKQCAEKCAESPWAGMTECGLQCDDKTPFENILYNRAFWLGRVFCEDAPMLKIADRDLVQAGINAGLDVDKSVTLVRSGLKVGTEKGTPGAGEDLPDFLVQSKSKEEPEDGPEEDEGDILGNLPEMPMGVFPALVREAITNVSTNKGVAPDMVGAYFLALASACIGRSRLISYSPTWSEAANLYILVAAETGVGKSHTQRFIFKELSRMEAKHKIAYQEERRKYEEAMETFRKSSRPKSPAKAGEALEMPKRPTNVQYMLDDSTIEAAVELLFDNPRGLMWLVDEFHGFFSSLDRYSGSKSGAVSEGKRRLLSAYDGRTISMSRKSKDGRSNEIYVDSATLSICGCVQTGLLPEVFSHADLVQGSPQRFLFVRCAPQKAFMMPVPEIPESVGRLISRITRHLSGLEMQEDPDGRIVGAQVGMADDARRVFEVFCNSVTAKAHGTAMAGFAAKMRGQALRLALALHYLRQACEGDVVDRDVTFGDMSSAVTLADYFYAQAQSVEATIAAGKPLATDAQVALAGAIAQHADKIQAVGCKVEVAIIKQWLREAGHKMTKYALGQALTALGAKKCQTCTGARGRQLDEAILKKCKKMVQPAGSVFDVDEDEDGQTS